MSDKEKDLKELPSYRTFNEGHSRDSEPLSSEEKSVMNPEFLETLLVETKKEAPEPPQMLMFDRYFMSLGRPMHHKAGMLAFCNTKGKKTREAWEALFEKY